MLTFLIVATIFVIALGIGLYNRLWLIGAIILFSPLYVIRFELSGLPGMGRLPTTLLEVLLLAYLAVFGWYLWRTRGKHPIPYRSVPITVVLPLLILANAALAVFFSPAKVAGLGIWRAYFLEPILFYLCLNYEPDRKQLLPYIMRSLQLLTWWIAVLGIGQYVTGIGLHQGFDDTGRGRILAVFNTPNAIGLLLAPLTAMYVARFVHELHNHSRPVNLLNAVSALLGAVAVFLAFSRGAWLGLVVALWITAALTLGKRILPALVILTLLVGTTTALTVPRFRTFFQSTGNELDLFGDNSANVRVSIWRRTTGLLADHPLAGTGLAGFQTVYARYDVPDYEEVPLYPHNIFLNFWSETGLAGLILFLAWYLFLLVRSLSHLWDEATGWWHLGLVAFLFTWGIHGLLDVPYFKNDLSLIFWTIAALQQLLLPGPKPTGKKSSGDALPA